MTVEENEPEASHGEMGIAKHKVVATLKLLQENKDILIDPSARMSTCNRTPEE